MLNLSVIGCGYWGPNLIRNFMAIDGVRLCSVCDKDQEKILALRFIRNSAGVTPQDPIVAVTDYRDIIGDPNMAVLGDPNVDAVVIATPPNTHFNLARKVLLSGRHVLVEKPMAMTVRECEELISLAQMRQKVLMVGHTFLYNDAVEFILQYIESGELGHVLYVRSDRLNTGRVRQDVNAMWNLAPHDLSILLYLLNEEPTEVSARGFSYIRERIDDAAVMDLEFPSGASAHIEVSWIFPRKVREMTIYGSKRNLFYDDTISDAKIRIYGGRGTEEAQIPQFALREPLANECRDFMESILEGRKPKADGESGLKVVRILEVAQLSLNLMRGTAL